MLLAHVQHMPISFVPIHVELQFFFSRFFQYIIFKSFIFPGDFQHLLIISKFKGIPALLPIKTFFNLPHCVCVINIITLNYNMMPYHGARFIA